MKKKTTRILVVALALVMALSLAACGGGEATQTTMSMEANGVKVSMLLDAEGDKIVKITQTSTIPTEGYTDEQKTALEETVNTAGEDYKAIEGVTYETSWEGSTLTEVITIPTGDEATLKACIDSGKLPVTGENVTQLSLEETKKALAEQGWTEE